MTMFGSQWFASAGSPVTISYNSFVDSTDSTTVFTFSSVSIGTASATRKVVIGVVGNAATSAQPTGVTIGGSAATKAAGTQASDYSGASMWYRTVTSGTTADVVVTYSASQLRAAIGSWSVFDAATSPTATSVATGGSGVSISCPGNGAIIGIYGNLDLSACTWTNLTERYDSAGMGGGHNQSGASDVFASATTRTITATGLSGTVGDETGSRQCLVLAAFGPA